MKSIWSGTISFGLVSIPIRLQSAVQEQSLGFTTLCSKCHQPLSYKRYCAHCKKEIAWEDVVKGLKQSGNKYFILTQENIKALKPEKTDSIDIIEFIQEDLIQPLYYENHFYIVPAKASEKPYFLFKKALEETGKVAVGQFVMRDKEYVCTISPYDSILMLNTLHYDYEVKESPRVIPLKAAEKITNAELTLAKQLISKLSAKKFDIKRFKDTFAERLKKALKVKGKNKSVKKEPIKKPKLPKDTLLSRLRESIPQSRPRAVAKGRS